MKSIRSRWWPAIVIILANLATTIWIWTSEDIRQWKVLRTLIAEALTLLLLLIWALFFFRLPRKHRLAIFSTVMGAILTLALLFKFEGITADFVPTFKLRWQEASSDTETETADLATKGLDTLPPSQDPAQDYPQFLGPDRDGSVKGLRLERDWEKEPPKLVWKRSVGAGWSAFSVAGQFAVTQEQKDVNEAVVGYDLSTGSERWIYQYPALYTTFLGGTGPRATPTIAGGQVYSVGAKGELLCLDLQNGNLIWRVNILTDSGALLPEWGLSCSPLVTDSLVIVFAGAGGGQSLIAYDRNTGGRIWAAGNDDAHYSSPLFATIAGLRQIVMFTKRHVVGHLPGNGEILWRFRWPDGAQNVAQPIVFPDGSIFVSTSYGIGSKLFRVERHEDGSFNTDIIWESRQMKSKFSNYVHREGYIYGFDDGILACLDLRTGRRRWKNGRYGHGQMLLVDDLLLISTERGEIALVAAKPDSFIQLGIMPAINGRTWNNPALAGPYLLVRNAQEAACFELPLVNKSNP